MEKLRDFGLKAESLFGCGRHDTNPILTVTRSDPPATHLAAAAREGCYHVSMDRRW
jgi:hypothetical protein